MRGSVDDIRIIRAGTTMRDHEVWSSGFPESTKIRKLEKSLGVLNLATVTLVQTDGKNILIDTSWEDFDEDTAEDMLENNRLILELQYFKIKPKDIDEVFVTHWHGDHYLNLPLFPNAQITYAGIRKPRVVSYLKNMSIDNEIAELKEGEEWHPGIEIISTLGHTNHDHSVVINFKKKTFVVTGDSIVSKMYYHHGTFFPNRDMDTNIDQLRASFQRIIDYADIIIPGHDGPFYNYKKLSKS